jgi:predicted nucleic acid-binding protein
MTGVFKHVRDNHSIVLCEYTLFEICNAIQDKFPDMALFMKTFIKELKYEYYKFNSDDISDYPLIRDHKDIPVLANAIQSNVDILLTGDKDFDDVAIDKPKIMKPREYSDEYMN